MAWTWSWRWSSLVIGLLAYVLPRVVGPAKGMLLGASQGLTPRPVCASQYALANYACSMIPYSPLTSRTGPPQDDDDDGRGLHHSHSHSHSHRRHHRTRSGSSSSSSGSNGHSHHRRRHHRHRRSRDGGEGDDDDSDDDDDDENQGTPEEEDCCRWLSEMDNDCVCEMLVRLPDFLSRPVHQYTVSVGDSCNVTYACGGRVIRK